MRRKRKLAIALGGGGVRGLANIGVLRALEEAGIKPDIVTGTSMGAIVGAVYADTLSALQTQKIIKEFLGSEEFIKQAHRLSMSSEMDKDFLDKVFDTAKKGYFFYRFLFRRSVISPELFFMEMDKLVPQKEFAQLKIPFACVALDIVSGCSEILHSGPVQLAVKASSAVPGVLPPVIIDNRAFVDGGWIETVPISAAKFLGADFIIGVDVSRDIKPISFDKEIKNSMDILFRSDDIARSVMNTYRTMEADFVIHPQVGEADWSDFDNLDYYIASGLRAAKDGIISLKRAKNFKKFKSILWKKN